MVLAPEGYTVEHGTPRTMARRGFESCFALKVPVFALATLAAMTGCASPPTIIGKPTGPQPTASCEKDCRPNMNGNFAGGLCKLTVTDSPVKVNPGAVVTWNLPPIAGAVLYFNGPGIAFLQPQTDFTAPSIDSQGQWASSSATSAATKTELTYTVSVTRHSNGQEPVPCELTTNPIIVNVPN